MKCSQHSRYLVALLISTATVAPMAVAQEQAEPDADGAFDLGTLTLNARLREEAAQDVPFSVSAFDENDLENQRIDDTRDLYSKTPNFTILESGNPGFSVPSIRGVGSVLTSASPPTGDDASVTKYVDGIPVPRLAFDSELFDVERVEVLRGPQGTLYGRNSTAGAINVFSNLPTFEQSGRISFEAGGPEPFGEVSGFINTPFSDTVAGRLAFRASRREVDTVDATTREPLGDIDIGAFRGSLVFDPDTPFRLEFTAFGETREDPFYGYVALGSPGYPEADRVVQTSERDIFGTSVRATYDLEFAQFTSLTGYTDVDFSYELDDTDGVIFPFPFLNQPGQYIGVRSDNDRQFFQEFRLNSYPDAPFQYVAGLTYLNSSYETSATADEPIFNNVDGVHNAETDSESFGIFGEATFPTGVDGLSATLGARYSWDDRDFRSDYSNPFGRGVGPYNQSSSASFEGFSGRASLAMAWTDEWTTYGTISRGYKPGGFLIYNPNAISGQDLDPYEETTVMSYEIGTKFFSSDGRFSFEAAAFFNDVSDEQIYANDGTFVSIVNADTESYGIELSGSAYFDNGFDLSASVGLLQAEITENITGNPGVPPIEAGNPVPYAPEVTASLSLGYTTPMSRIFSGSRGDLKSRIDVTYRDSVSANAQESLSLDSFTVVDASVAYQVDNFQVELFVENLFDEDYQDGVGVDFGAFGAFPGASPGEGRRIGLGVSYEF